MLLGPNERRSMHTENSGRRETPTNLPSSCIEGLPSTADSDGSLPHPREGGYTWKKWVRPENGPNS